MVSIFAEYRLFDEDNCRVAEEGDFISLETHNDTYKDVSISKIGLNYIVIEDEECAEIEIDIDDIIDFEVE